MKVSLNELKKFTDVNLSVDELVAKIGAQLGEVEEVIDLGRKYKGIVIAKVVSCVKHPNADKLSLCQIDNGKEQVQVVCGAPNAREGLLVAWLPPGATVPATFDKDPLVLEAREIRGQVSNGMLASPSELGISDDHSGILEIEDGKPGDDFAKTFGLYDYIIDIENKMFTHRPDLFGMLGIAREIAGIQQKSFKSPSWYTPNPAFPDIETEELKLEVNNEILAKVPRFVAITMRDVRLRPSPLWLQVFLAKVGIKSISNIVDYSNYFMMITAQPIHIYDYDKVKALSGKDYAVMVIRHANEGETITILNGKTIKPDSQTMMVATDQRLICVGGAIGGVDTEVDENTKNIIIEAANWDMFQTRRTSMQYGIFTDSVTRLSKGQSPIQNAAVVAMIVEEIRQNAGGKVASKIIDIKTEAATEVHIEVLVSTEFINSRLGLSLASEEIVTILKNVEFVVEVTRGEVLIVKPPFWRTDIEIAEDVVEEVGRLYGYDHLPLDLPKRNISPVGPDDLLNLKTELRNQLAKSGANEVLTYSFVPGNLLEKAAQDKQLAYKISNALSPDLQHYRLSLTPSLLDKVHANIKAGVDKFAIFEIGKVHGKSELDDDKLPKELERLALVFSDKNSSGGAAYYQALSLLDNLVYCRFGGINLQPLKDSKFLSHKMFAQMCAPYDPDRSAVIQNGDSPLGIIGEFKNSIKAKFKLPARSSGFELFLNPLLRPKLPPYLPLSKYPSVEQDITLKSSNDMAFKKISDELDKSLEVAAADDINFETRCLYIFSKDNTNKNTTFRITVFSYDRTLTTEMINKILDKASEDLVKSIGAQRI